MATRKALTGGTGDVNPQPLSSFVVQSAADTTTQQTINLPIPRLPTAKGKAMVMEVLKVKFYHTNTTALAASTQVLATLSTNATTFASATAALQDTKLFSAYFQSVGVSTSVGGFANPATTTDETNDQAGHGEIIATDKIYLTVYSAATGVANEVVMRMKYRFKQITTEEYVGVVQAQQ